MSTATVIPSNRTHHFVFNATTPGILPDIGLEIDNEFFLISLTTTLSVIILIRFLIIDAYKVLRLFKQRHQTAFRSTLVLDLSTVDEQMTIDLLDVPTCPTNIDFSGLKAPVDLAIIPEFRNFVLNLGLGNTFVMDLSTDFKFSMPTFLPLGYHQARAIRKISARKHYVNFFVRHMSNIVLIPRNSTLRSISIPHGNAIYTGIPMSPKTPNHFNSETHVKTYVTGILILLISSSSVHLLYM